MRLLSRRQVEDRHKSPAGKKDATDQIENPTRALAEERQQDKNDAERSIAETDHKKDKTTLLLGRFIFHALFLPQMFLSLRGSSVAEAISKIVEETAAL